MQAVLALEDGRIFRGKGYGAKGECYGEVVFNTSITGYQEIFTDPSYAGQIVVLTHPEIGNYGTTPEDNEANRPYIEGLIVREFSRVSSNWRSQEVAEEYLERYKIPVLADIDTRALVRHLRDNGVMRGVISTIETDPEKLVAKARSIPKIGTRPIIPRMLFTAYVHGSGSPGPFDRNTPSGFIASTSSAEVSAGTTVTRQHSPTSLRRMLCLMP